jgi:2-dehydro-3-deoxygluconokinase
MKVGCIGEPMVELSLDGSDTAQLGYAGDTLNTAIYLARAGGCEVHCVTSLGGDAFSDKMVEFIAGEGVEVSRIARHPTRRPGLYAITTDASGERSFTYWRDNAAAREMFGADDALDFSSLDGLDVAYFSAITLAILSPAARLGLISYLTEARARSVQVAFDSNFRPALWESHEVAREMIEAAWQITDIALPSIDDEMQVFEDDDATAVVARFKGYGVKQGALKNGPSGPISLGEDVEQNYLPAGHVVDTTAAGDSFNAGYLGAILTGDNQAQALVKGHDLASMVVGVKGAIAPKASGA